MKGENLNAGLKRLVMTSLVAVMLGAGLSGCSMTGFTSASDASASAAAIDPAAKGVQQMVDDFYRQVKTDTAARQSGHKKSTSGTAQDDFNADFEGSRAYIKAGSMTQLESRKMLATFARVFAVDPEAKVEAAAEDFVLSGNTASLKSGRLKVTTKGKLQPSYDDAESATLHFELMDGKWMITRFDGTG
jgi:hypothetical protein